ncbi:MAG: alpha/beta hydrolase [Methanoregulaceae archaeon]|nr:alpha/beta hydrolase [Methanoregulaceae archaeon]
MRQYVAWYLILGIAACVLVAGCTSGELPGTKASYQVDSNGVVTFNLPAISTEREILAQDLNYSIERVVFHSEQGNVYGLVSLPAGRPVAAFILAPGAGVRKEAYRDIAATFAKDGYIFLVLDIRGNGGETSGYPLNLTADYERFVQGEWPEYYTIAGDLISARQYITRLYNVPVYIAGESNGGRYAVIAAAQDPASAGYIGISTSGFRMAGEEYTGQARLFLLSVDPDVYVGRISPRPIWIFHSRNDSIISFEDGKELFGRAGEPKEFIAFNGTHGINDEVVGGIIERWAQIYRPEGRIAGSS